MTTTTYLGSGDPSRHRRNYRPGWLENLPDDVTMEGFGPRGDHDFVEDYASVVRSEPIGGVVVMPFSPASPMEAGRPGLSRLGERDWRHFHC